ncbi:MAG: thiamine ABC transporter substrate-binding protein [Treponema sp.]|nr:thiamine ABC transporter substrate-binding protein [Treponema sp.]
MKESLHKVSFGSEWHKINLKFLNCLALIAGMVVLTALIGCKGKDNRLEKVIVYTYNSFSGEWGAGPEVARLFKEKTGLTVEYADCGDGGQILSKALLEKDDPYADVLIGLDNSIYEQAIESKILLKWKPKMDLKDGLLEQINENDDIYIIPYDYSPFAFMFDTQSGLPAPKNFEDLTKSIYKKKIILMDYRTSTPGLGFKKWVEKVYGDKADDYMNRLNPNILTTAPSWSVGYGMFTEGEAPLVISYTTSEPYHVEYDKTDRYKALAFDEGHLMQVEGAAVLNKAKNKEGAKKLVEFLVSEDAQKLIAQTQWMFPSNKNIKLPQSYDGVINPEIIK